MSTDKKVINMDSYSLQKDWLENVAPNFFDVENNNMLRVGMLGYINEVMANVTEDSHNLTNMYYNEIIPNRAELPETIYSNASLVNYNNFHANPAEAYITLAIKKKDLIEHAKDKITHKEFYISKNSYFFVDDKYKFMIDHPIIITIKSYINSEGKSDWVFTPRYDLTSSNIQEVTSSPYINSFTSNLYGEDFVFLNIKTTQIDFKRQTINVYSSNLIDNLAFRVEYSGQLAHFKVYYKENDSAAPIEVTPYFMDNLHPTEEFFCFYKYLNDNIYEIFFSPYGNNFRPDIGSILIIDTYTTLGSEANFDYVGTNVNFYFENDYDDPSTYISDYSGVVTFSTCNTPSVGGENTKTLSQLKKRVVEEFSLRNSIITESDLNIFFNNNNFNSSVQFIKKRDDVIQRLFSAYILFKDENNTILPTNTVTTIVDQENIDTYSNSQNIYMLKAGKQFIDDPTSLNKYEILDEKLTMEEVTKLEEENGRFFLTNPFLMRYSFNPVMTNYYYNSANDVYSTKYTYMNKNSYHEFSVNGITITRNALTEDRYTIEFEMSTNLNLSKIFVQDPDTLTYRDTGELKFKGIFKNENKTIGYIDFQPVGLFKDVNKIKYKAVLKTTDFIDLEETIEIENSIKVEEAGRGKLIPSMFLPGENLTMEICCFHRTGDDLNSTQRLQTLIELQGYTLVNIYETEQPIKLFINLDNIIHSKLVTSLASNGDYIFRSSSVPMVRYSYVLNSTPQTVFRTFKNYLDIINENVDKLENNFDIDLKFFNTYGKSRWFKLSDGVNSKPIDKTNITINLRIKTSITIDQDKAIEIRELIAKFVDEINIGEPRDIYISNLIRTIEQKFDYVTFVQFNGINNETTDYQIISNEHPDTYAMDRTILTDFVPEFINVNKQTSSTVNYRTNTSTRFTPDIKIEYI